MHTVGTKSASVAQKEGMVTTDDGLRLYTMTWTPPRQTRSLILLVHGLAEHTGRYAHVASLLASNGHAVFGFDLRGHGRSEGDRAYIDRFGRCISDLRTVAAHARQHFVGDRPLFVLGHSLGGLIALHHALSAEEDFAGSIVSSPYILPSLSVPRPLLAFANVISRFFPKLPTLRIDGSPATHDPAMEAAREADPLFYEGRLLARTGNEMRLAGIELCRRAGEIKRPLLLFHGTEDHLADWRGSFTVYGSASSEDKTLTLYRGLFHETMNETNRDRVLGRVLHWLDERSALS